MTFNPIDIFNETAKRTLKAAGFENFAGPYTSAEIAMVSPMMIDADRAGHRIAVAKTIVSSRRRMQVYLMRHPGGRKIPKANNLSILKTFYETPLEKINKSELFAECGECPSFDYVLTGLMTIITTGHIPFCYFDRTKADFQIRFFRYKEDYKIFLENEPSIILTKKILSQEKKCNQKTTKSQGHKNERHGKKQNCASRKKCSIVFRDKQRTHKNSKRSIGCIHSRKSNAQRRPS